MVEIQKLLDLVGQLCSENRLKVDEVKSWLGQYLAMHEAEVARFPNEQGKSHWDLIAADYDRTKEAQFLAALFAGDHVTLLAGLGPIAEVRDFAERAFPENSNEVLDELTKRFKTGERRSISLGEIIKWVQC